MKHFQKMDTQANYSRLKKKPVYSSNHNLNGQWSKNKIGHVNAIVVYD